MSEIREERRNMMPTFRRLSFAHHKYMSKIYFYASLPAFPPGSPFKPVNFCSQRGPVLGVRGLLLRNIHDSFGSPPICFDRKFIMAVQGDMRLIR